LICPGKKRLARGELRRRRGIPLEDEIAAEFMRCHPGLEVQIESFPANYKEKILTYIASGEPPDFFCWTV